MELGVNNQLENGLCISVDWISFTVKNGMSYLDIISAFGLNIEDFLTDLNGRYGYKKRIKHTSFDINVLYDGNEGMGIHMEISGSSVGYFLNCYKEKNTESTPFGENAYTVNSFDRSTILTDVLREIMDMGRLTRLDLAIDDIGCKYYSVNELADILDNGLYTSRFKSYVHIEKKGKGNTLGNTINLGSRKSDMMIRVYDKMLEQNSKKCGTPITKNWVRWESELHDDRACAVALFLIGGDSLSNITIGILNNYLRLIVRDNERDSRCSNSEKWNSFLCGIQKVRLCQPIPDKTLEEKEDWLMKQAATSIAAIYHKDGDLNFIYSLIESGSVRMSVKLWNMVQDYGGEGRKYESLYGRHENVAI